MNQYEPTIEVRAITAGAPYWHAVMQPMIANVEARSQKPHSSSHPDETAMIVNRKEPKIHPAMRPSIESMAGTLSLALNWTPARGALQISTKKHATAPGVVLHHPSPMQIVRPVLNRKMAVKLAAIFGNHFMPKRPTMGPAIR